MTQPNKYTDKELLDGLREADEQVENTIKFDQFDSMEETTPGGASTFLSRFGSWNEAKKAAGLQVNKTKWDNRETSKEYRRRLKEAVSCSRCGESFPSVIDFHHPPNATKSFEVTQQARWPEDIKKEAEKCIPLCKNCHGKHHSDNHTFNANNLETATAPEVNNV